MIRNAIIKAILRVGTAGKKRQKKPIVLPDGTEIVIVGGIPVRRRRKDAPVSKNDSGKSPETTGETTGANKAKPARARAPERPPKPEKPEEPEGLQEPPEVTRLFKEAELLFIDGDSDKAAELFGKIVAEHPGTPSAAKAAEYLAILE